MPPGQGVTVQRGDRAGCGAGEDGLDSHGKILSNAEPTFAWQSKGQGFESPQLHSRDSDRLWRVSAGSAQCGATVVDLLVIDYSRAVRRRGSKMGARRRRARNVVNVLLPHMVLVRCRLDAVRDGSGQVDFGVASAVDVAQAAGQWVGAGRRAGYGRQ